jgi:hypothetical protein
MFFLEFVIPMLACEPTTILALGLVLTAASTATTLYAQQSSADAQTDYQTKLMKSRNEEFTRQAESAQLEASQQKEANARRLFTSKQASLQAQATAKVAAGEAGVSGASVGALLRDFQTQQGLFEEASIRQNQLIETGTSTKLTLGQIATRTGNVSVNSPIASPNYVGGLLQLGQSSLEHYGQYKANTNPTVRGRP